MGEGDAVGVTVGVRLVAGGGVDVGVHYGEERPCQRKPEDDDGESYPRTPTPTLEVFGQRLDWRRRRGGS